MMPRDIADLTEEQWNVLLERLRGKPLSKAMIRDLAQNPEPSLQDCSLQTPETPRYSEHMQVRLDVIGVGVSNFEVLHAISQEPNAPSDFPGRLALFLSRHKPELYKRCQAQNLLPQS